MRGLLDFTTSDIFVSTTNCKACRYTSKYDMKTSLTAKYADQKGESQIQKLDIYYPREETFYFNGTYIRDQICLNYEKKDTDLCVTDGLFFGANVDPGFDDSEGIFGL
jgi:hypothetical protein